MSVPSARYSSVINDVVGPLTSSQPGGRLLEGDAFPSRLPFFFFFFPRIVINMYPLATSQTKSEARGQ